MNSTLEATGLDTIETALLEIAAGRPVLVVDDEDRENEGDIIFAAEHATRELLAFTIRYSSGVVCVSMGDERADALELPPMTAVNEDRKGTAFTVSVDAREGVSTGISAADRAHTIRLLADPVTGPGQLSRPGHVFPLRARPGGVIERPGHTEAAVDLARLAGLTPIGVLVEVVNDDGGMARLPELRVFAARHGLALVSIADLIAYRTSHGV
jgi:3,4-dihydroxy 2-butanone 4-phosphate synthase/GTP cyclohydrolase II